MHGSLRRTGDTRGDRAAPGSTGRPGGGGGTAASPAGPALVGGGGIDGRRSARRGPQRVRARGRPPPTGRPAVRSRHDGAGPARHMGIPRPGVLGQIPPFTPRGDESRCMVRPGDNTIKLRGASSIQPHRCGRSSPGPTQGMRTGRPAAPWTGVHHRHPVPRVDPCHRVRGRTPVTAPGTVRPTGPAMIVRTGYPGPVVRVRTGSPAPARATTHDLLPRKDRGRLAHRR
ncbi:hypothetical protein LQ51_28455 [Micromonospora sp. HK10]|nr:hypothetical protein LQ51_28455 [Micromonospora sp. HK10]